MDYDTGSFIPDHAILKKFIDEDGAVFLEVRGQEGNLFRITEGNRVYYQIKKSLINDGELTLTDDFSHLSPEEALLSSADPEPMALGDFGVGQPAPPPEPEERSVDGLTGDGSGSLSGTSTHEHVDSREIETRDVEELDEGDPVPPYLRHKCKQNEYGGYSLRHKKFLYILDSNFCVDVKTANSVNDYDMQADDNYFSPPNPFKGDETIVVSAASQLFAAPPPPPPPMPPSAPPPAPSPERLMAEAFPPAAQGPVLKRGDVLPESFRDQCEQDMGGTGSRITIGNYLYVLDAQYRVVTRMGFSVSQGDTISPAAPPPPRPAVQRAPQTPPAAPVAPTPRPQPTAQATPQPAPQSAPQSAPPPPKPKPKLPMEVVVANVIKLFDKALTKYEISADFFRDTVLARSNEDILFRAYRGDLAQLNDDTRAAYMAGQQTVFLNEGGFSLFKAALIHELYIKTTLSGRGDNMKFFLSVIAAAAPDLSLDAVNHDLSLGDQHALVEYFGSRARVYPDKTAIINRLHQHFVDCIFEEYGAAQALGKKILFKGFMLMKLYQQTTRLDRGDGLTMIRLGRDIIGFTSRK